MNHQKCYNGVRLLGEGPCEENVNRLDMGATPFLFHCMQRGMQVDLSHFERMDVELGRDMERITEEVKRITGYYINLNSGDQKADLLFKKLKLKQARPKMTKSGDRESVEDEVLTAIQHDHPVVPLMQDFNELSKLRGTYVRPIPKLAKKSKFGVWRIYPNLGHTRVPSGRLNAKDPNLLAIPNRTDRGREVRDGFITDPGWKIVSIDESQIEVRTGAHCSGDPGLIKVYENEEDVYSDFATAAFRLDDKRYRDEHGKWIYPTVHKQNQRFPAKTCVLASIYDVTASGLLEQMPVVCKNCNKEASKHDCSKFESLWNENNCQDLINAFYIKYPGLLSDRKVNHKRARRFGYLWDQWGRILHVAAVRSVLEWVVSAALREAANFVYQCISGESLVVVQGEGIREIEELVNREVTLWDGSEWATGYVVPAGIKDQIEIELYSGLRIRCSPDHQILTADPVGFCKWVKADNLINAPKCRRVVISQESLDKAEWDWIKEYPISYKHNGRKGAADLSWMKQDLSGFGEFLGRLASDGSVLHSQYNGRPRTIRLLIAEHEKEILPILKDYCLRFGLGVRQSIRIKGPQYAPMHILDIESTSLATTLSYWGIKNRIPDIVMQNSTLLKGYLRGMFDGDGGIVGTGSIFNTDRNQGTVQLTFGANNARMRLARDVNMALLMLGIKTRFRARSHSIRIAIRQRDLIKFQMEVGFINPQKIDKLQSIIRYHNTAPPAYGEAVSIKKITHLPPSQMFDFVNSSTGKFCCDGIVVHNSTAQGTIKLVMAQTTDEFEEMGVIGDVLYPLLQVHDELIYEVREDMAEEIGAHVSHRFENCVRFLVPIKAGVAIADRWGKLDK